MSIQAASGEYRLCQHLAFNTHNREERLALMRLSSADIPVLRKTLELAITPSSALIVDRFYDYLLGFPQMRKYLGSDEHLLHVKALQTEYLLHFGVAFDTPDYFEYRLRIGIAHERLGLPIDLYLAAYRALQDLIIEALPTNIRSDPDEFARYTHSISKIVMLDISLAIDAYTRQRVEGMSESLEALAQERDTLNNQLMRDTLTGVLSRRFVLEALNKQLAQLARQPQHQLCLALLDLDHFKRVNDGYGHLVGDKVLYEFSRVVASLVREQDYFGRFGGEEFLLILTDLPATEALNVLNRICDATRSQAFTDDGTAISITVSIGFTTAQPNEKVDDLIERADSALYQAKQSGRDQVIQL